jgi:hypothetical protein
MNAKSLLPLLLVNVGLALSFSASGQAILTGTNYSQNFNSISNGLPPGWSVRTNATATSLGQPAPFPTAVKTWGDTTGEFGNCAGIVSNAGTNYNGGESTTIQSNTISRCLAVRQTGAFGDPGAAFVFQMTNTTGFSNLTFSVDLCLLKSNGYSTTWTIDYAVGNTPASFTPLGTNYDPGIFSATNRSFTLGTNAENQTNNVWIRIAALSAATGVGSRDTFGIDNFSLNYAKVPTPSAILSIQIGVTGAVLSWNDPTFNLQSAPAVTGTYTNISNATSPFTNALEPSEKYFRLIH